MASNRKLVFAENEYYHIYNRGVEKRNVFSSKNDYNRFLHTVNYYRFQNPKLRFSKYLSLNNIVSEIFKEKLYQSKQIVDIVAFCFMPNHFHFLLKQKVVKGIPTFISRITNSYTKYFNTKYKRVGPLFQGVFKAVYVEDDEQLVHLSRYIHLNPVANFLVKVSSLPDYQWSSFPEYLKLTNSFLCQKTEVMEKFSTIEKYRSFVFDQIKYSQEIEKIKHLTLE